MQCYVKNSTIQHLTDKLRISFKDPIESNYGLKRNYSVVRLIYI